MCYTLQEQLLSMARKSRDVTQLNDLLG